MSTKLIRELRDQLVGGLRMLDETRDAIQCITLSQVRLHNIDGSIAARMDATAAHIKERVAQADAYLREQERGEEGDPPLVKLAAVLQALEFAPAAVNLPSEALAVVCRAIAKKAKAAATTASAPADAPVVAWMLRNTETGEIYWDETECLWSDAASANEAADGLNENVVGGDAEGPWEAIPLYTAPLAPASVSDAPVVSKSQAKRIAIQSSGAASASGAVSDEDTRQFWFALERVIKSQRALANGIDRDNPGDPYAVLGVWDDVHILESFASRHASQPAPSPPQLTKRTNR